MQKTYENGIDLMRLGTKDPWVAPTAEILIVPGTAAQLREQVAFVEKTSPKDLGAAEHKVARWTAVKPLILEGQKLLMRAALAL